MIGDLQYSYDAAGRRMKVNGSFARTNLPSVVSSAVYDDYNRLTAWNGQGITYDENGNMLSDGSRTYTWDTRDRLKTISGSSTASFKYDAMGRRLTKTINGTTTSYQYDGDNIVGEFSATNAPNANVSSFGVDGWLSRTEGATSRQFLTDALGSVIATTDGAGILKTQYTYEPYGKTTSTGEVSSNPFKYTGREDDGTGLYYYRARYYNPTFQRFISSDPIGLSGGPNTYEYVGGNPLSFTDPSGKFTFLIAVFGCAIGGGFNYISGSLNGASADQLVKSALIGCATGAIATISFPAAVIAGALNSAGNRSVGLYTVCDPLLDIAIGGGGGALGSWAGSAAAGRYAGNFVAPAVEAFGAAAGVTGVPAAAGYVVASQPNAISPSPQNCRTPALPTFPPLRTPPTSPISEPRSRMAQK